MTIISACLCLSIYGRALSGQSSNFRGVGYNVNTHGSYINFHLYIFENTNGGSVSWKTVSISYIYVLLDTFHFNSFPQIMQVTAPSVLYLRFPRTCYTLTVVDQDILWKLILKHIHFRHLCRYIYFRNICIYISIYVG